MLQVIQLHVLLLDNLRFNSTNLWLWPETTTLSWAAVDGKMLFDLFAFVITCKYDLWVNYITFLNQVTLLLLLVDDLTLRYGNVVLLL